MLRSSQLVIQAHLDYEYGFVRSRGGERYRQSRFWTPGRDRLTKSMGDLSFTTRTHLNTESTDSQPDEPEEKVTTINMMEAKGDPVQTRSLNMLGNNNAKLKSTPTSNLANLVTPRPFVRQYDAYNEVRPPRGEEVRNSEQAEMVRDDNLESTSSPFAKKERQQQQQTQGEEMQPFQGERQRLRLPRDFGGEGGKQTLREKQQQQQQLTTSSTTQKEKEDNNVNNNNNTTSTVREEIYENRSLYEKESQHVTEVVSWQRANVVDESPEERQARKRDRELRRQRRRQERLERQASLRKTKSLEFQDKIPATSSKSQKQKRREPKVTPLDLSSKERGTIADEALKTLSPKARSLLERVVPRSPIFSSKSLDNSPTYRGSRELTAGEFVKRVLAADIAKTQEKRREILRKISNFERSRSTDSERIFEDTEVKNESDECESSESVTSSENSENATEVEKQSIPESIQFQQTVKEAESVSEEKFLNDEDIQNNPSFSHFTFSTPETQENSEEMVVNLKGERSQSVSPVDNYTQEKKKGTRRKSSSCSSTSSFSSDETRIYNVKSSQSPLRLISPVPVQEMNNEFFVVAEEAVDQVADSAVNSQRNPSYGKKKKSSAAVTKRNIFDDKSKLFSQEESPIEVLCRKQTYQDSPVVLHRRKEYFDQSFDDDMILSVLKDIDEQNSGRHHSLPPGSKPPVVPDEKPPEIPRRIASPALTFYSPERPPKSPVDSGLFVEENTMRSSASSPKPFSQTFGHGTDRTRKSTSEPDRDSKRQDRMSSKSEKANNRSPSSHLSPPIEFYSNKFAEANERTSELEAIIADESLSSLNVSINSDDERRIESSGIIHLDEVPRVSRLPPDGHEFPDDKELFTKKQAKDLSDTDSSSDDTGDVRHDEKSKKSVKEKIKLFNSGFLQNSNYGETGLNQSISKKPTSSKKWHSMDISSENHKSWLDPNPKERYSIKQHGKSRFKQLGNSSQSSERERCPFANGGSYTGYHQDVIEELIIPKAIAKNPKPKKIDLDLAHNLVVSSLSGQRKEEASDEASTKRLNVERAVNKKRDLPMSGSFRKLSWTKQGKELDGQNISTFNDQADKMNGHSKLSCQNVRLLPEGSSDDLSSSDSNRSNYFRDQPPSIFLKKPSFLSTNNKSDLTCSEKCLSEDASIVEKEVSPDEATIPENNKEKRNGELSNLGSTEQFLINGEKDCEKTSLITSPKPALNGIPGGSNHNRMSVSAMDIRRAFEKAEKSLQTMSRSSNGEQLFLESATESEESSIPSSPYCWDYGSNFQLGQLTVKDQFGSISSVASSTSMISPQELQGLIEDANQSLEESGTPSHEILVVVLHREHAKAGSVGVTLAGGADCENREITIHKVIPGSLADRDGRVKKGDRVLSINGKSTKGLAHKDAFGILKAPRPEVVLVLSRNRSGTPTEPINEPQSRLDNSNHSKYPSYSRPSKLLETATSGNKLLSVSIDSARFVDMPRGPQMTIVLQKEGPTSLGFSLEGGKDSPHGDRPLTIKKIFSGGAADKEGSLKVGDEIVSVNNTDCSSMSRIEAWNFIKKLPVGSATLVVRQALDNPNPLQR